MSRDIQALAISVVARVTSSPRRKDDEHDTQCMTRCCHRCSVVVAVKLRFFFIIIRLLAASIFRYLTVCIFVRKSPTIRQCKSYRRVRIFLFSSYGVETADCMCGRAVTGLVVV